MDPHYGLYESGLWTKSNLFPPQLNTRYVGNESRIGMSPLRNLLEIMPARQKQWI